MDPRNSNHPQRFAAKSVLKLRTTKALRERLQMDWALQRICGCLHTGGVRLDYKEIDVNMS